MKDGIFTIKPINEGMQFRRFPFASRAGNHSVFVIRPHPLWVKKPDTNESGIWVEIRDDVEDTIGIGYDLIVKMNIYFYTEESLEGFEIPPEFPAEEAADAAVASFSETVASEEYDQPI